MIRVRLSAPTFHHDVEVPSADELIEVEGMTWSRDGEADGLPRYAPVAAG